MALARRLSREKNTGAEVNSGLGSSPESPRLNLPLSVVATSEMELVKKNRHKFILSLDWNL
jgi:hypothetical protein